MNRKDIYIEAFNRSSIEKKIRSVKAIEKYGKLSLNYKGVNEKIDSIASCLDAVYPEKWDILLRYNEKVGANDNLIIDKEKYFTLDFILHFPEINITNSSGMRHKIVDLYIKLLPYSHNNGFTFHSFQGKRMTATEGEIFSSYQHSHLPSRNYKSYFPLEGKSGLTFNSFCLGTSEIRQVLTMLSSGFKPDIFKLFLMQLEEYLNWESLEGTPHIKIANVIGGGECRNVSPQHIRKYYIDLIEKKGTSNINFIITRDNVKIAQDTAFEEYLKIYDHNGDYPPDHIAQKDSKGNYYTYRNIPKDLSYYMSEEEEYRNFDFIFKGEIKKFKVIPNEETVKPFFITKTIKDYVTKRIESKIQKSRIRRYIIEQLDTIENTKESTRKNRLFMPEN